MSKLNDLSEKAIIRIKSIPFYGKIGQLVEISDATAAKSVGDAVKHLESVEWMNTRLDWSNALTRQLSARHRMEYREWNNILDEAESRLERCWIRSLSGSNPLEHALKSVRWDMLAFVLERHFSPMVEVHYFERLIPWYESGHIPCGWEGKYPSGKLVVY